MSPTPKHAMSGRDTANERRNQTDEKPASPQQLPWTPPLSPLTIKRPSIPCEGTPCLIPQPALTPAMDTSDWDLSCPSTPRDQGIPYAIPGAPKCNPSLGISYYND